MPAALRKLAERYPLGIRNKGHVNRGFEPSTPGYNYYEVSLLSQVPPLLGI